MKLLNLKKKLKMLPKCRLNPKNIGRIPKSEGKEMFIGIIDVGGKEVTINVRNFSSKLSNNEPTLELLRKEKNNSKKIRYVK